jgi:hypothetical protein
MQPAASKLYDEAVALWHELCHGAPPKGVGAEALLALAVAHAQVVGYDRLHSPHLRESTLSRPKLDPRRSHR